ncbi:MAG: FAD:protein FMN transferase [Candidatus Eisenbacteria bacterium]
MLSAALAGALPSPTGAPAAAPARVERVRYLMGTLCTASASADDTVQAGAALAAALDEIARLERVMSSWREDSELSLFNRAAGGGPVACSPDLAAVLDSALVLARLTDGAFDPTVEPLVSAWDLRGDGRLPGPAALAAARDLVGWPGLALDPNARTAHLARAGMGVDLGGIGKGFALDRAAATLARRGVTRALINLGGELLVLGGGESVTVAHPAHRLSPVVEIPVADAAVSTSGQSERGFTAGGVRYGHILDPRTGRPAPTAASVTVVCRSATRADALSTALLVMGRERAAAFARAHADAGVLWLEPAGRGVRAWCWNLHTVRGVLGSAVEWMNEPQPVRGVPR